MAGKKQRIPFSSERTTGARGSAAGANYGGGRAAGAPLQRAVEAAGASGYRNLPYRGGPLNWALQAPLQRAATG